MSCWGSWKFQSLFVMGCVISAVAQTNTTIQVPLASGETIAVVKFDESRHSAEDVKHWMELSSEGYYSLPQVAAQPCRSRVSSEYVPKYRTAIDETGQIIKDLDASNYPRELSEVVTYLHRLQSFWLWKHEQELEFLSAGSLPPTKWDDIETRDRCNWTIQKLHRAKSSLQQCRAVLFDWGNCVNKVVQEQIGKYPKESWDAFIRSQGLEVQMLSTEAD
jgi:hypothetical protein